MEQTESLIISLLITLCFWGFYYAYCKFSFQNQEYNEDED